MLKVSENIHSLTDNQKAVRSAIKFLSALIITSVVVYCEIMYLQVVADAFPDGIWRTLASIGAIASGLSVLVLILAKMFWFPDGGQMVFSWLFAAGEVAILIFNLILSFEMHWNQVDAFMAGWRDISPSTPVIALVGWIIIWMLDTSTKQRQAIIKQENRELESALRYRGAFHTALMDLENNCLSQTVENLKEKFNSDAVQAQLQQGADRIVARVVADVTGMPALPPSTRKIIEANPGSRALPLATVSRQRTVPAPVEYKDAESTNTDGFFSGLVKSAKDALQNALQGEQQTEEETPVVAEPAPTRVVKPLPKSNTSHPSVAAERRKRREARLHPATQGSSTQDEEEARSQELYQQMQALKNQVPAQSDEQVTEPLPESTPTTARKKKVTS